MPQPPRPVRAAAATAHPRLPAPLHRGDDQRARRPVPLRRADLARAPAHRLRARPRDGADDRRDPSRGLHARRRRVQRPLLAAHADAALERDPAVLVGVLSALVITGRAELWHLYVLAATFGIVDAFFYPALNTIVPMLVPERQLAPANALVQSAQQVMGLIGPALAGALVAIVQTGPAFVIDAASFAVAAVAIACSSGGRRQATPTTREPSVLRTIADGRAGRVGRSRGPLDRAADRRHQLRDHRTDERRPRDPGRHALRRRPGGLRPPLLGLRRRRGRRRHRRGVDPAPPEVSGRSRLGSTPLRSASGWPGSASRRRSPVALAIHRRHGRARRLHQRPGHRLAPGTDRPMTGAAA